MKTLLLVALVVGGLASAAAAQPPAPPADRGIKRPMTLDDLYKFKRVADPQVSPDGKFVAYQMTEITDPAANKQHTHLWLAATDGRSAPRQLTASGKRDAHPRWSPDGTKLLFESTRGGTPQLFVLDLKNGGEARAVTTVSTGAGTGVWSPDGSHVAFVSAVFPEFSTLPFAESDAKNKEKEGEREKSPVKARVSDKLFHRHWDSQVENKRQHLFVCGIDGSDCRDVTPGDRDANPTSSTFSVGDDFCFTPDGKHLVFTAVPAAGEAWSTNHDLCRVSVTNTATEWETLTKENKGADNSPRFSPDGKKLAYRSQKRAGYEADKWDILVVDVKPDGTFAGAVVNLTAKKDVSIDEVAWGPVNGSSYQLDFVHENKGRKGLWRVEIGSGGPATLEVEGGSPRPEGAVSGYAQSADGKVEVMAVGRLTGPAEVYANGQNVSAANTKLLAELDLPKPESVEVAVEGNVNMQMWVLKPPGFDPSKKYPLVYLIHGGPQGAWEDGWSFRWCPQLWAAQGYVIAMPNPRGSTGFGQKFVDEISGDWGGKCYRDLVAGLEYLKKQPYVDSSRLASAGASFGGYMQDWFAVSEIAKEFKCLISHCSVWNFESMWGTTDELWFDEWEHQGLPWEKPGKYREFSPHTKAGNLGKYKTPMLVIHNDLDFRCPIGQGHELFAALQRQGVPSRFVNFPDEGHWVTKPANGKFWHQEVFAWLTKYAPPGGR
jgi:dipeptidyl aminopeptidase/acylaminoacyl peptidase